MGEGIWIQCHWEQSWHFSSCDLVLLRIVKVGVKTATLIRVNKTFSYGTTAWASVRRVVVVRAFIEPVRVHFAFALLIMDEVKEKQRLRIVTETHFDSHQSPICDFVPQFLQFLSRMAGYLNLVGVSTAFHATGCVNRVTEQAITRDLHANDASNEWTGMESWWWK